jgi:TPR repeat protein
MNYVINLWEQPSDAELAPDITVVAAAVAAARKVPTQTPPKFQELAKRLMDRYPGAGMGTVADNVWSGGGANVPHNLAVWDLALNEESEKREEVVTIIAAWATDLGLNVYDKEASEAYLADGRVISRRPQARCVRGLAAYATKDFTNAWHYFMAEANRGNRLAMENLAMMAVRGEGVPRCKEVAYALFMRANNTEEAEKLGKYMDAAQVDAAAKLLSELRESTIVSTAVEEQVKRTAGSASGQYKILDPNATSRSTEPEFARNLSALPLDVLLREAQQGHRHARYELGLRFKKGNGVSRDHAQAAQWWYLAAADNVVDAQFHLALVLLTGDGVSRDVPRALVLFGRAADNGHVEAIHNLGDMYQRGEGTARDAVVGEALHLYAIDRGRPSTARSTSGSADARKLLALFIASGEVTQSIAANRRGSAGEPAPGAEKSSGGFWKGLRKTFGSDS